MFDDPQAAPIWPDRASRWSQNLGAGAAGTALLHIARAHAGTGTWANAHSWATAMTRQPITVDPDASGLFDGPMAVAYVLRTAHQDAYAGALDTLDRHVNALTRDRLARAHERIDRGELPPMREYDLISGLTGTGAYLLHRGGDDGLLTAVLNYLVRLTAPITSLEGRLPGWWTRHGPSDQPEPDWIGGHANLGMAHGIAGPLALMSIAVRRDITVPGQLGAIDQISAWLDSWRIGTDAHTWWPGMISLPEYRDQAVHHATVQRPSWCYGTPGLARAQQLAAIATGNKSRQQSAENTLLGCLNDPHQLALLTDSTVCHGWAGIVLTTRRIAADAPDRAELTAQLPRLRDGLYRSARSQRTACT